MPTVEVTIDVAPASGTKTLLTWDDLAAAYQGWWMVPVGQIDADRFGYSSGVHTQLPNGNLLMVGHDWYQKVREVVPPTIFDGRQGTAVGVWSECVNKAGFTTPKVGGLLADGLIVRTTIYAFYNGPGDDEPSQGTWDGTTISGPWQTSTHDYYCNGYLSPAPDSLKALGWDYLAGQYGTSGAAINNWGPNLFAIQANPGGTHSAASLVHYPSTHPLPGWSQPNNGIYSMLWIDTPTKHVVLQFGNRALSGFGYKCDTGLDPYKGCGGPTAREYESFAQGFDPQDCLDVLNGLRDPWTVVPVWEKVLSYGIGVNGSAGPGSTASTVNLKTITLANGTPTIPTANQFANAKMRFDNDTPTVALRGQEVFILSSTATSLSIQQVAAVPAEDDTFTIGYGVTTRYSMFQGGVTAGVKMSISGGRLIVAMNSEGENGPTCYEFQV